MGVQEVRAGEPETEAAVRGGEGLTSHVRFELKVVDAGRKTLARLTGPLDLVYGPTLTERLDGIAARACRLVLDLRRSEYVDSDGVRALLRLHAALDASGGQLRLVVLPGGRVERNLCLLRLQHHLRLYSTVHEAWGEPGAEQPR
jgi:anti-anti-sigma factor